MSTNVAHFSRIAVQRTGKIGRFILARCHNALLLPT